MRVGGKFGSVRLEGFGVSVVFAGVKALVEVDVEVEQGEILGLIGPNGAGKTTLVNVLSGFQRPTEGRVLLDGKDITRLGPPRRARLGLARTFQGVRIFPDLTVYENVELGAIGVRTPAHEARTLASDLLKRFGLAHVANEYAASLPQGDERRVGILRALALRPRFLLLDEPAAGLNESESDDLVESLAAIRETFGCGLVVIEHDMRLIMRLCDRIHVLDHGRTISGGAPADVRKDPAVLTAYLGTRRTVAAG